ncbi:MAG: Rrf2 family transcriptional regulator [Candidatus Obscuribacterales bacterium]|nr:Rrf2 family transcriptional regulator [Candidatus Obscuribacterales bacterium]
MISQTAEYALRAIVFLSMNGDAAYTTQQISAATKVPAAYLSKVLKSLVRADLIQSQRGIGGGFVLSKPPEAVTILQVVSAVDPIQRINTCPLGLKAHGTNLCALHKQLDDATAVIEKAFRDTTIADVLARPTKSIPLCDSTCKPSKAPAVRK